MEECRLPCMPLMIALPSDFIVHALLRFQIGRRLLSTVITIHLGKGWHDKGLADVQIDAAVRIQFVQPLCRGTEVAVILTACSSRCPRLTQPKDSRIVCIKFLLPLGKQSPIIARITLILIAGRCRQCRIYLMLNAHAKSDTRLRFYFPCALHIRSIGHILFTRVIQSVRWPCTCSPIEVDKSGIFQRPRIEVKTAPPVRIMVVQLRDILLCLILAPIVLLTDTNVLRSRGGM